MPMRKSARAASARQRQRFIAGVALAGLALAACAGKQERSGPPRVVTTIGMIADMTSRVAGPHARVDALMGAGVDPHLYKASESDVRRLAEADLILYNGLHLEGKMGDILVKMASTRAVVPVAEAIPEVELREPPELAGHYDPHIWFDVSLWARTIDVIERELSKLDPPHAEEFKRNAGRLRDELRELDEWVGAEIATIPVERRVLVTAHDAFGYFGRRYNIEVRGLQGISTAAEAGLKDVDALVAMIAERKVKAIFVETSVPKKSIEAVQAACKDRGHDVAIGGLLYSDAMGAAGTPDGTYIGMVRHNVTTIVEALR
ncbi:MAG: metal ABC transporter solute-binding protein, Zn/Mn family [bacterium]